MWINLCKQYFIEGFILLLNFVLPWYIFSSKADLDLFGFRDTIPIWFNRYTNYGLQLCFLNWWEYSDIRRRSEEYENPLMFVFWSTSQTVFRMCGLLKLNTGFAKDIFCSFYILKYFKVNWICVCIPHMHNSSNIALKREKIKIKSLSKIFPMLLNIWSLRALEPVRVGNTCFLSLPVNSFQ